MAARRPASADCAFSGVKMPITRMKLRHAHHDLVVDRIDDAGCPVIWPQVCRLRRMASASLSLCDHHSRGPGPARGRDAASSSCSAPRDSGGRARSPGARWWRGCTEWAATAWSRACRARAAWVRQERPHHLVADGVDHAAVEIAHDRHFAFDQRVALLESLASGRGLVEHAHGHGEPAAHVVRHRLVVLGQAVVHETPLAPVRHETAPRRRHRFAAVPPVAPERGPQQRPAGLQPEV